MHFTKINLYTFIDDFDENKILNLKKNSSVIFRNYEKKVNLRSIIKFNKLCKSNRLKFYLTNNIKLALQANLNGVYIPSFNKRLIYKNLSLIKKFRFIGSAHNISEIKIKEKQNCEDIFLSPIFKTDKNKDYLDTIKFNLQTLEIKKNIIALGGINSKNLKKINLTKSQGIASISWIKKNGLK